MTGEHEKEVAARLRAAASAADGIREELKRGVYTRREIVAAGVHQGLFYAFTEKACRSLYDSGLDDRKIAAVFGLTPWDIFCWRKKRGLEEKKKGETEMPEKPNPGNFSVVKPKPKGKIDHDQALFHYNRHLSDTEIAKELGVTPNAIWLWRKRNELPSIYIPKEDREKLAEPAPESEDQCAGNPEPQPEPTAPCEEENKQKTVIALPAPPVNLLTVAEESMLRDLIRKNFSLGVEVEQAKAFLDVYDKLGIMRKSQVQECSNAG